MIRGLSQGEKLMQSDIAVVIGAQNAKSTICQCLDSVLAQLHGLSAEVLVADSSTDGTDQIVEANYPSVLLLRTQHGNLVPHLWGLGMERANARVIALTTAHCIPDKNWIAQLLSDIAERREFDGIGGPVSAPQGGPAKDWAVYFSRYSAFMPPSKAGAVADIPGDNAAYRKEALDQCWENRQSGFWETLFHNSLRKAGRQLYMSPQMGVALGHTDSGWDYFWVRFRHGVHYGATRPNNTGVLRLVRICAAPILVPYLVLRIGRRVAEKRPDWLQQYYRALPWLLFFMTGWSLGEVKGYVKPEKKFERQPEKHREENAAA
jgi:hypothetical protein